MLKEYELIPKEPAMHRSGWVVVQNLVKDVLSLNEILWITCDLLNVTAKLMRGRASTDEAKDARRVYCYYSKFLTTETFDAIGEKIYKHHTSALQSCQSCQDLLTAKDEPITDKINLVGEALKKLMHEKVRN